MSNVLAPTSGFGPQRRRSGANLNDNSFNSRVITGGNGGGGVPPEVMERVAKLEAKPDDLPTRKDFASLQVEMARLGGQFDGLRGQLDGLGHQLDAVRIALASLPTWWQVMRLFGITVVVSTVLVTGIANLDRIIRAFREIRPTSAPAVGPAAPARPAASDPLPG